MAKEKKATGEVTHWYDHIGVAVVKLSAGISVGDKIKIKHGESEAEDTIASIQLDHKDLESAKKGQEVAIKISGKAKVGSTFEKI